MEPREPIFGPNAPAVFIQTVIFIVIYVTLGDYFSIFADWLVCETTGLCSRPPGFHQLQVIE